MSAGAQTPKIIVSYRRTDAAMAGRIFDRLVQRFGKKSLFIDIDNIPFGGDFRRHIDDALKSSDLLIALVGPRWAGGEGKDAKITREADPVRVEIETALKQNITGPSRAARRGEDARAVGASRKHPRVRLSQCGRGRVGPRLRHSCRPPDQGGRADPRRQGRTRGFRPRRRRAQLPWSRRPRSPAEHQALSHAARPGRRLSRACRRLPSVATVRQARWRRCLSPILSRQALGQEANELSERGHRYEVHIGSDEPVPHIRESVYTDGRGNILRIEVDVPSSLIRQAPAEAVSEQPAPHRRRTRRNRPTRPEPIAKT